MLIFFAIVTTTLLVFQKDPEVHHHFYGGIGEGEGQAYHHYSGSQSQLRPTEQWTPSIPEPYTAEPSEEQEDPYVSYENYNFDELPFEPRNAALTLGYTAETWDFGEEDPPVFSKPWFKLTREEKNAADVLGFSVFWDKSENDENFNYYGESSTTDDYYYEDDSNEASSSSNSDSEE